MFQRTVQIQPTIRGWNEKEGDSQNINGDAWRGEKWNGASDETTSPSSASATNGSTISNAQVDPLVNKPVNSGKESSSVISSSSSTAETRIPLGVFLAHTLVNQTVGTLSIDLKRPQLVSSSWESPLRQRPRAARSRRGDYDYNSRQAPRGAWGWTGAWEPPGTVQSPAPTTGRRGRRTGARRASEDFDQRNDDLLPDFSFNNAGARIKAMRHVSWGPKLTVHKHGVDRTQNLFDIGAGLTFELDTAALRPVLRMKVAGVASLKLFPEPTLKISKSLRLGTTDFSIRLAYECPLESVSKFYAPPARFLVTLDSSDRNGIRLTQSGLEFSANRWLLDETMRIKANGVLSLPNELPIAEDEDFVKFNLKRLGLKAKW